jgi:hypothetical protein
MKWFKIDGREWNVRILEPEESFTILYSENTGRTLDDGAPMTLDPLGTFFNYTLTVAKKRGHEEDFDELWDYLSTPRDSAMLVVLPRNQKTWKTTDDSGNEVDGFYAYVSNGKRKIKKIIEEQNGELKQVDYEAFSINFIATKAQVLPIE